jgi:hypothetical protein
VARTRRPHMAASTYHDALRGPERPEKTAPERGAVSETEKRGPGRPTIYSDELAYKICSRLAEGNSLKTICKADDMPDRGTVTRWLASNALFAAMIMRARELQAEALVEEAMEIADEPRGDVIVKPDGSTLTNWENVQRSKLRVDTRRWYAAKLAPKKFGELVTQEIVGANGGPVLIQQPLTERQIGDELSRLPTEAEREIGLPTLEGVPNRERLRNILVTGHPLTPDLYRLTHERKPEKETAE